jgi:hypothetical protein
MACSSYAQGLYPYVQERRLYGAKPPTALSGMQALAFTTERLKCMVVRE